MDDWALGCWRLPSSCDTSNYKERQTVRTNNWWRAINVRCVCACDCNYRTMTSFRFLSLPDDFNECWSGRFLLIPTDSYASEQTLFLIKAHIQTEVNLKLNLKKRHSIIFLYFFCTHKKDEKKCFDSIIVSYTESTVSVNSQWTEQW